MKQSETASSTQGGVMRKPSSFTLIALCLGGALLTSCGTPEQPLAPFVAPGGGAPNVVVTPSEATVPVGETQQLEARFIGSSGEPHANREFTWSSSNEAVASVSATGLVTGVTEGSAIITATTYPFSGTALVTVVPPPATHPEGVIAGTTPLGSRPFGAAVSAPGAYHITRGDDGVERGDLPDFAFTANVTVGAGPTQVAFSPSGARSYVTNQLSQTLGIIDVAANTQVKTIPLSGDPFYVAASPDGSVIYVTDNAAHLYAIDAATETVRATLTISSISNGLAFTADGSRVYASTLFTNEIVEVDARGDALLRRIPIPGSGVLQGIAISTDGSELYVLDQSFAVLRVVSVASGTEIAQVRLDGFDAFALALSPDNAQVYAALTGSGVVRVIDRASRTIVKSIQTGGAPRRIAFSARGETAVIANESGWVDFVR
jgi:YVTN family beta-propeller protein